MNFRPDEVNHAFKYLILARGNSHQFFGVDMYIRANRIKAWYFQSQSGTRVYAIPVDELNKLPNDDGDPYLCTYDDPLQGWGLYPFEQVEEVRVEWKGTPWYPLFDTRTKFCLTYCGDGICDCMDKNLL